MAGNLEPCDWKGCGQQFYFDPTRAHPYLCVEHERIEEERQASELWVCGPAVHPVHACTCSQCDELWDKAASE